MNPEASDCVFVVRHLSCIHITGMLLKIAKEVMIIGWQFPEAKILSVKQKPTEMVFLFLVSKYTI